MSAWFRKKTTAPTNSFLVLDIGTEVIKALVCQSGDNNTGHIVGVGKAHQRLGDMHHGTIIDLEGVIENCREAVQAAENQAGFSPTQLIIGLAGELVKGSTTTVCYRREKPQLTINMDELNNVVHRLQWEAFSKIRQEFAAETGLAEIDIKLVNAAIVQVQIDGYRVSNPLGFQGRDIVITIFNSFAPLVHFSSILTVAKQLGKEILSVVSEPYALSRCLGYEDGSDFSALFIDIGGGTTDLAVVMGGGVVATKMFSIGGRVFTKRIAKHLNLSFLEAEKEKLKFSKHELRGPSATKIEELLATDTQTWLEGLALSLQELNLDALPTRILLCGGGSKLPLIKKSLESKGWDKALPFGRAPRVNFLAPRDLVHLQDDSGKIIDQQDITPLALAALGLSLTGQERVLTRLLKKAVRMLEK